MATEYTAILMEIYMMEIGKMGNNMERDFFYIKVEIDFKVHLLTLYARSTNITYI